MFLSVKVRVKNHKGGVLFLFVILFLVFLGMGVLGVDVGLVIIEKAKISTAADAGALAGADVFLKRGGLSEEELKEKVKARSKEFFYQNYFEDDEIDFETELDELENRAKDEFGITLSIEDHDISLEEQTVTLRPQRTRRSFFAAIFDRNFLKAEGYAKAQAGYLSSYLGVKPFGLPLTNSLGEENLYRPGDSVMLKMSSKIQNNDSTDTLYQGPGPGNWQLLRSPGNENLRDLIVNGITDFSFEIDDETGDIEGELDTATGQKVGQIKDGILELEALCQEQCSKSCTPEDHDPDCPLLAVVPIVNYEEVNGRSTVTVVGFATVFITGYDESSKSIMGTFVEYTPSEKFQISATAPDYGSGGILLVE